MVLTLMAVHAHPDDEAVFTGGTLARYAAEGVRTVLVTCTGGEVGEISDPALATPDNLGMVRAQELAEAARLLNITHYELLGYRDSGMIGTEPNGHPECFWQADLEKAVARLVRLMRHHRPHVVVTYDENGNYGHPDHIQANRITMAAFHAAGDAVRFPELGLPPWQPAKLYFSASPRSQLTKMNQLLKELGMPNPWVDENDPEGERDIFWCADELVTATINTDGYQSQRREALRAHRTQMPADSFFFTMPEGVFNRMWAQESYRRAACLVEAPAREDDLFSGLREGKVAGH